MSSYPFEFMGLNTSLSFIWTKSQVLRLCLDKEGPVTFYLSFPKAVTKYLRGEGGKPYCLVVLKVLVHRHLPHTSGSQLKPTITAEGYGQGKWFTPWQLGNAHGEQGCVQGQVVPLQGTPPVTSFLRLAGSWRFHNLLKVPWAGSGAFNTRPLGNHSSS